MLATVAASFRGLLGRQGAAPREIVGAFPSDRHPVDEQPLRAELFSIDQRARHAAKLASTHWLARARHGNDETMSPVDGNEADRETTQHRGTGGLGRG